MSRAAGSRVPGLRAGGNGLSEVIAPLANSCVASLPATPHRVLQPPHGLAVTTGV